MPAQKIKDYLDSNHIKYVLISHSPAFTALEIAQSAHLPGQLLAKTVIVKLDGKMAMVVLPAAIKVNLDHLKKYSGVNKVELANELEFKGLFPGCEAGAMPPFGMLYGMDVYVDNNLAKEKEIAFNAGTHSECIKLAYDDFAKLSKPKIMS